MTARLLLADDQELMRMGFRMVIDTQEDSEIVGEASNWVEASRPRTGSIRMSC